ncbi:hypothetical protein MSAN_02022600 [Mycena sanguinolenta]|uniref:Uncharacterized protein n=1 Tax=Mycena sanguinolenta TaxID=230812 RepID=A0A8H7CNM4_9AGAR|nr:hypothetical protein MSAN_02022600 [Mycena sanguinolenta]
MAECCAKTPGTEDGVDSVNCCLLYHWPNVAILVSPGEERVFRACRYDTFEVTQSANWAQIGQISGVRDEVDMLYLSREGCFSVCLLVSDVCSRQSYFVI